MMNDPHVVSLKYRLKTIDTVSFSEPSPIEAETETFRLKLANEILDIEFKEHIGSIEAARRIVEPYLRAWEIDNGLHMNRQEIRFSYDDAVVIDRNPPAPGSTQFIYGQSIGSTLTFSGDVKFSVARHNYPAPPTDFVVNETIERLWERYENYARTRDEDKLLSMSYYILTYLEKWGAKFGRDRRKREKAADYFGISLDVLNKLGDLSTNRGDERTARKEQSNDPAVLLTAKEEHWLASAMKAIIRRLGEMSVNPNPEEITMDDLPKLS